MRYATAIALLAVSLGTAGCAAVNAAGVKLLYRRADLPPAQVVLDVCYLESPACDSDAHRLDLYLSAGKDWPIIVFIHGGGWDEGDDRKY